MLFINLNSQFAGHVVQALSVVAPYCTLQNYGEVSIPYLPDDETTDPGHRIVRRVVDASAHIYVDAELPSFVLPNGRRLHDVGAQTLFATYPPIDVHITLDGTNCLGQGYGSYVGDPPDMKPIPIDVALFHELSHAAALVNGVWPTEPTRGALENAAVMEENRYRRWRGYPGRFNTLGEPLCTIDTPSTGEKRRKGFNWGCFIATAAYPDIANSRVESLRALRDGVLRRTRTGAAFFERYWRRYYQLSPRIVEAMNADPSVREMVRWSMVEPMLTFCELLVAMPSNDIHAVPEPWRTFLLELDGKLDSWRAEIDVPLSFDGMTTGEIVEEIAVVLRYVMPTGYRRQQYLITLRASGLLPLPGAKTIEWCWRASTSPTRRSR